jgi:hypothetical protein
MVGGTTKDEIMSNLVECNKCLGKGRIDAFAHIANGECFACGGTGKVEPKSKVEVGDPLAGFGFQDIHRDEMGTVQKERLITTNDERQELCVIARYIPEDGGKAAEDFVVRGLHWAAWFNVRGGAVVDVFASSAALGVFGSDEALGQALNEMLKA